MTTTILALDLGTTTGWALASRDGKQVYRIDDGIPVLLVEESLQAAGLDGLAAR